VRAQKKAITKQNCYCWWWSPIHSHFFSAHFQTTAAFQTCSVARFTI